MIATILTQNSGLFGNLIVSVWRTESAKGLLTKRGGGA